MTDKPESLAELQKRLDGQPVLMLDGKFGMIICVPTRNDPSVGIQVPGEEDIRWRELSKLVGDPLVEKP